MRFAFVTVVLLAAVGCSSSVLVKPNDVSFRQAQEGAARTARLPEVTAAPEAERVLFLQAEGLYRYRFDPPPRTFGSYAAQAAAVAVDFPALQALAGSLDLIDLRLKAYDGAVHLWESLLALYPRTTLRPLVLYRLGWAYRSSGATGFPRQSGDEAWDELVRAHARSRFAAVAARARQTPWKSKDTATALSIVPGLGQFYVGERLNGAVRLSVALAAVAMIVVPSYLAYRRRDDLSWGRDWPLLATGLGGIIVLSIDYTTAYQDALRGVVQWNERVETTFHRTHADAP